MTTEKTPQKTRAKAPAKTPAKRAKKTLDSAAKSQIKIADTKVIEKKKPHGNTGRKRSPAAGRQKADFKEKVSRAVNQIGRRLYVPFSEDIFVQILEGLATYDDEKDRYQTLSEVLKQDGMPSITSFYRWLDTDETGELRNAYSYVSLACVDAMADEMLRVAYDAVLDPVVTDKGIDWHKMSVPRSKLIADTLQWLMSRKAPEKWSGTVKLDVTGDVNPETMDILSMLGEQTRKLAIEKAAAHAELLKAEALEATEEN